MDNVVHGTHTCFVCHNPFEWVGELNYLIPAPGLGPKAQVIAVNNGAIEVFAYCPHCQAGNKFQHKQD